VKLSSTRVLPIAPPSSLLHLGSKKKKKKKKKKKDETPVASSSMQPLTDQVGIMDSVGTMASPSAEQPCSPPPPSGSASSYPYAESDQSSLYGSGSGKAFDGWFIMFLLVNSAALFLFYPTYNGGDGSKLNI
jgi:hypothetical protein